MVSTWSNIHVLAGPFLQQSTVSILEANGATQSAYHRMKYGSAFAATRIVQAGIQHLQCIQKGILGMVSSRKPCGVGAQPINNDTMDLI